MQRYLSLNRLFQRRKNSRGRKRRGLSQPMRRLCHEHLEDRSLLAVLTVDSLADSGTGSLRAAIDEANNTDGPHTIDFAEELAGETITLESGELHITDDLTIIGLGADQLTISGNNASRIFLVDDGNPETPITVSISGFSLENGSTSGYGGAIRNLENLTVEDCVLANNSARYGGGGIYTFWYSTLTVTNSTLANNSANYGGGIFARRKPRLSSRYDGRILYRPADRQLQAVRSQHPPRYARSEPVAGPVGSLTAVVV